MVAEHFLGVFDVALEQRGECGAAHSKGEIGDIRRGARLVAHFSHAWVEQRHRILQAREIPIPIKAIVL
jgi:hypothetical protein